MKSILERFSPDAVKFDWQIGVCLTLVWITVVICAISSVVAQPFPKLHRIFWIVLIVCVPIIGLLAYLPFSFRKEDLPHMFMAKRKKEKRRSHKTAGDSPGTQS